MAASLGKRQDAASPWAFVAFEAEAADPVWEAFEPEIIQEARFAPFESIPGAATAPAVPEDLNTSNDPFVAPPEASRHEADSLQSASQYEKQLRALEETHQAALAELERRYAEDLIGKVSSQIELQGRQLANEIETRLVRLLAPLLMDHARKASLAALTRDLQRILTSSEVNQIMLKGPGDWIKQMQEGLGEQALRVRIQEADSPDVKVLIDPEVIATRLSAWADVLKEVIS
jgi:hypothetical protein